MKRIKAKPTQKKGFLDTKEKVIAACITGAVILLVVFVLMLLENNKGKLIINNNTDYNLDYVNSYFVMSYEDATEISLKDIDGINANKKSITKFGEVDLRYTESNLEIVFQFENHEELFVDSGIFNDILKGNVNITFDQTKDPDIIKMKVKAKNGILPSKTIICNDEYMINLKDNEIME